MIRVKTSLVGCVLLAGLLSVSSAGAQDVGATKNAANAGAKAGPVDTSAPLPAGHPVVDPDEEDDPHGHAAGDGHSHAGAGMNQEPEDGAVDDPTIPPGRITVHVVDANGQPIPRAEVTLGILHNTVAQGESRKRVTGAANDQGDATFDHLESGSGIAYRAMVLKDGATFSVPPFRLTPKSGARALLHVYPVVNDIAQTMIVTQSMLYTEVKDDRIQVQEAFKIYNFGRNAWVPSNVEIPLPPGYTAFTSQQGMTDVGVDAVPDRGIRLRGTFSPGQHVIEFRWQLPYAGESEVRFDVGMSPNLAASRVIAPAARSMKLEVSGFPQAQASADGQGQRALVTERQFRREEPPVKNLTVVLSGLPTEGNGKVLATLLAFGAVVVGLVLGTRKPIAHDPKAERERLLLELEALEKGRAAGDIGPKTYERARRELMDDLARTFAEATKQPNSAVRASKKGKRTA
ncbi:hypothetical protein AKJ09_03446 [Labilithrix luteola]|uniref:Carboxypeptidase regulatory-like domain-containing protein n=1 Tax=Labilithrix luteola TaxID=1391654 RepID=A0A0K1PTE5_9BACT|nr:carboxypeptidase-like regulatory domain-containing protein [Labilithrix luteola]AKU96782.1 hypothetical protein AKJ09_03446 [Labilithrix luteola]